MLQLVAELALLLPATVLLFVQLLEPFATFPAISISPRSIQKLILAALVHPPVAVVQLLLAPVQFLVSVQLPATAVQPPVAVQLLVFVQFLATVWFPVVVRLAILVRLPTAPFPIALFPATVQFPVVVLLAAGLLVAR